MNGRLRGSIARECSFTITLAALGKFRDHNFSKPTHRSVPALCLIHFGAGTPLRLVQEVYFQRYHSPRHARVAPDDPRLLN